jgi:hypothetical protein
MSEQAPTKDQLPESLRDPMKVLERGRQLEHEFGPDGHSPECPHNILRLEPCTCGYLIRMGAFVPGAHRNLLMTPEHDKAFADLHQSGEWLRKGEAP